MCLFCNVSDLHVHFKQTRVSGVCNWTAAPGVGGWVGGGWGWVSEFLPHNATNSLLIYTLLWSCILWCITFLISILMALFLHLLRSLPISPITVAQAFRRTIYYWENIKNIYQTYTISVYLLLGNYVVSVGMQHTTLNCNGRLWIQCNCWNANVSQFDNVRTGTNETNIKLINLHRRDDVIFT